MVRVSTGSHDRIGRRDDGASPGAPRESFLPSPASTLPRSPRGSGAPNWNWARRPMAFPAITDSDTAASMKPAGANTRVLFAADIRIADDALDAAVMIAVAVACK